MFYISETINSLFNKVTFKTLKIHIYTIKRLAHFKNSKSYVGINISLILKYFLFLCIPENEINFY